MFSQLRPILRCAKALEDIAKALTYFAVEDARGHGRLYITKRPKRAGKDESELMHTDNDQIDAMRRQDDELILQRGYGVIDELEAEDR